MRIKFPAFNNVLVGMGAGYSFVYYLHFHIPKRKEYISLWFYYNAKINDKSS